LGEEGSALGVLGAIKGGGYFWLNWEVFLGPGIGGLGFLELFISSFRRL